MPAEKAPGTVRIFVLGESAAQGDPAPAFGPARELEVLLRERHPERRFEVVNVAMTAINSHAILPIARECAKHQGDYWVVYMGNNEMVGPFGAATVFGEPAPALGTVRMRLALQRTRVGQLLARAAEKFQHKSELPVNWRGMEMFMDKRVAPDDPRRKRIYESFASNLDDILRAGLKSGARILLSTVAVNLKDCPPFASLPATNLAAADRERLNTAAQWEKSGRSAEACSIYEALAPPEKGSADFEFAFATCLRAAGRENEAKAHFLNAVACDELPFRADPAINDAIRKAGEKHLGPQLVLLDGQAALETAPGSEGATNQIAGQEYFYEHVHFNFDGSYRIARAWAEGLESWMGLEGSAGAKRADGWLSQEACERRLGLTDWNRYDVLHEEVRRLQQPPLSAQPNNSRRMQALTAQETALRERMTPEAAKGARALFQEAIAAQPEDYNIRENFSDFLAATGDYAEASAQWEAVRKLIPQDQLAGFELGRLAFAAGDLPRAEADLREAVRIRFNFSGAWLELGRVEAAQSKFEVALRDYEQALRFQPDDSRPWYFGGLALSKLKRREDAIAHYREAVRLNPNYWEAHMELGGQLGLDNKFAEAQHELEEAVRLQPGFAMAHLDLGVAFMMQNQFARAREEFRETLRLEPTNHLAPGYLEQAEKATARATGQR